MYYPQRQPEQGCDILGIGRKSQFGKTISKDNFPAEKFVFLNHCLSARKVSMIAKKNNRPKTKKGRLLFDLVNKRYILQNRQIYRYEILLVAALALKIAGAGLRQLRGENPINSPWYTTPPQESPCRICRVEVNKRDGHAG